IGPGIENRESKIQNRLFPRSLALAATKTSASAPRSLSLFLPFGLQVQPHRRRVGIDCRFVGPSVHRGGIRDGSRRFVGGAVDGGRIRIKELAEFLQ